MQEKERAFVTFNSGVERVDMSRIRLCQLVKLVGPHGSGGTPSKWACNRLLPLLGRIGWLLQPLQVCAKR